MWFYRNRQFMRGYAHVVIIAERRTFVHVAAATTLDMLGAISKVCTGTFDARENAYCYVVRPKVPENFPATIFAQRAVVCIGITFGYDGATENCETFANAVVGKWNKGHQASAISQICFDSMCNKLAFIG